MTAEVVEVECPACSLPYRISDTRIDELNPPT
jgi:hypothetical protein